ncbi:ribokinase [Cohnella sp. REN36]|uniref:ribokinase n=1 Tax=Cohnella sp. REN36 TaxID=2887347 RepID=UPI001D15D39B|nr:ribokinase [Cohnella sp. REN36]MCC3372576.1 ribokinase [Cohnella sp. REN36]
MTTAPPVIAIVGSLNMDIVTSADRFPVPGETMFGRDVRFRPGGKGGNQAVACARLGLETRLIGAVGEDAFGRSLVESLNASGVRTEYVKRVREAATGTASITLTPEDNTILVVPGANAEWTPDDFNAWSGILPRASVLLVQLEIPLPAVAAAMDIAWRRGIPIILNPAPARDLPEALLRMASYVTPNQSELHALTGIEASGDGLERAIDALLARGPETVVATLGGEGAAWKTRGGELRRIGARRVEAVDTTGAGDAFNAALACSVAAGRSLEEGVRYAVAVAALAVTKRGAQEGMPTARELNDFLRANPGAEMAT